MKTRTLAAALCAALTLVACGDAATTTSEASPTSTVEGADITTIAVDFGFDPDAWTIQAGAGRTVELTNRGTLAHNFVVLSAPIAAETDLREDLVLFRLNVEASQVATGAIAADLAPGTYQVICDVAGHFSAGMVGELNVTG